MKVFLVAFPFFFPILFLLSVMQAFRQTLHSGDFQFLHQYHIKKTCSGSSQTWKHVYGIYRVIVWVAGSTFYAGFSSCYTFCIIVECIVV
jgi:hypothetical protein